MRTIFIGQNQCETSSTDDINAKIGKLADNSNDLNNFEAANAKLTEILSRLNPNRATGSIAKRSGEIAMLERLVKGGEEIPGSIEEYQRYLHAQEDEHELLKRQMKEAGEKQEEVSRQQSAAAKKSEWERLKKTVVRRTEEGKEFQQKFPGNIPEMEDVKDRISECGAMERAHERVLTYQVSEEERREISLLGKMFGEGVPSEAELEGKIEEAIRFRNLCQEHNSQQMSPAEKERLDELESCFGDERESVTAIVGKWNNRNATKAALPSKKAALMALKASLEAQKPQESKRPLLFLVVGIVLAATGLFVAVKRSPVVGIIIGVLGIGLLAAGILGRRNKAEPEKSKFSPEFEELCRAIEEDEGLIARTDQDVAAYLREHGKSFDESTVSVCLQEITEESIEYSSLKKKNQQSANSISGEALEDLRQSINIFLRKYGVTSADLSFADDLYILKSRAEKYAVLADKMRNLKKAEREYESFRGRIISFLKEYGYEPSDNISLQIGDIRDSVDDYQDSMGVLEEAIKELRQFEAENDVSALHEIQIEEALPTLEELNQRMQQLTEKREAVHNKIGAYNSTLENLQEQYDEWEENKTRLDELKALQEAEQKKYSQVYIAKKSWNRQRKL